MGWGMDFAVLIFENEEEIEIAEILGNSVYKTETASREIISECSGCFPECGGSDVDT